MEAEIRRRKQRHNEPFRDYVTEIKELMSYVDWSEEQKLDVIYLNADPHHRFYIKREDFANVSELLMLAQNLNLILGNPSERRQGEMKRQHRKRKRADQALHCSTESLNARSTLGWDDRHIFAEVTICGVVAPATIDTGSTRSFLSEEQVEKLGIGIIEKSAGVEVVLADGSHRQLNQTVKIETRLGNSRCHLRFLVMPNATEDVLLGLDFCKLVGATFSCGGESVKLDSTMHHIGETVQNNFSTQAETEIRRVNSTPSDKGRDANIDETVPKVSKMSCVSSEMDSFESNLPSIELYMEDIDEEMSRKVQDKLMDEPVSKTSKT